MFVIVLDPTNSSQSDNLPQLTINILDKYTEFRSTLLNQPVRRDWSGTKSSTSGGTQKQNVKLKNQFLLKK